PAWDLYKWYVAGGATLLVVQSTLIIRLLASRAQRRRAQSSLAERLRFETLLSEVSAEFLTLPASAVDDRIERMLQRVVETLDFDRVALAERQGGTNTMHVTHTWARAGPAPVPVAFEAEALPLGGKRLAPRGGGQVARLD